MMKNSFIAILLLFAIQAYATKLNPLPQYVMSLLGEAQSERQETDEEGNNPSFLAVRPEFFDTNDDTNLPTQNNDIAGSVFGKADVVVNNFYNAVESPKEEPAPQIKVTAENLIEVLDLQGDIVQLEPLENVNSVEAQDAQPADESNLAAEVTVMDLTGAEDQNNNDNSQQEYDVTSNIVDQFTVEDVTSSYEDQNNNVEPQPEPALNEQISADDIKDTNEVYPTLVELQFAEKEPANTMELEKPTNRVEKIELLALEIDPNDIISPVDIADMKSTYNEGSPSVMQLFIADEEAAIQAKKVKETRLPESAIATIALELEKEEQSSFDVEYKDPSETDLAQDGTTDTAGQTDGPKPDEEGKTEQPATPEPQNTEPVAATEVNKEATPEAAGENQTASTEAQPTQNTEAVAATEANKEATPEAAGESQTVSTEAQPASSEEKQEPEEKKEGFFARIWHKIFN